MVMRRPQILSSWGALLLVPALPLGLFALTLEHLGASATTGASHGLETRKSDVRGTLYASLESEEDSVPLAGFRVFLKETQTGQRVAEAETRADGMFSLAGQPAGRYVLCWEEPGWEAGCHSEDIVLAAGAIFFTLPVFVHPAQGPDGTRRVVRGRVELADGSVPGLIDAVFGVEDVPGIRVPGTERPVRINEGGEFVVPAAELPTELVARIGRDTVSPERRITASDLTGRTSVDLRSSNRPPQMVTLRPSLEGRATRVTKPGTVLEVHAEAGDPDHDGLEIRWAVFGGSLSANRGETVRWQMPGALGTYTLYALASDGRGGYARGSVKVKVTQDEEEAAPCQPILCKCCPTAAKFLVKPEEGSKEGAEAYYLAADPKGQRNTLGKWWAVNGFGPNGGGGIRASYLNHSDLGFGRDMHCRAENGKVACYVTNYGCGDQKSENADLADKANPADRQATVTMEYSPVEGKGISIVKFFAYAGGTEDSKRVLSADLDGYGLKFIPQLCVTCHGTKTFTEDPDLGASFREFDLPALRYTKGRDYEQLTKEELALFKELNLMVKKNTQPSPAISELIDGWYPGGNLMPVVDFVPAGWKTNSSTIKFYRQVVATSCRTCHVAFRPGGGSSIDWRTYDGFLGRNSTINKRVCTDRYRSMPHAAITFKNFWKSENPDLPDALLNFDGPSWKKPTSCK
jgi:hypothetical protein